ncbi:MAG: hypothetical protein JNK38_02020 [Acidobacteria bacterium]|nr:hypothetical protein [Acidobacteriota bacterium]
MFGFFRYLEAYKLMMPDHQFNACLTDYLREVFCQCPRCGKRARIQASARVAMPWLPTDVTFLCTHCVLRHGWPLPQWQSDFINFHPGEGREPYFGYPLWAIGNIGSNSLAILNTEHASDLIAYVSASDRPRPKNTKWAMVNRLPKWVLLRKNRDRVLALIKELKKSLE